MNKSNHRHCTCSHIDIEWTFFFIQMKCPTIESNESVYFLRTLYVAVELFQKKMMHSHPIYRFVFLLESSSGVSSQFTYTPRTEHIRIVWPSQFHKLFIIFYVHGAAQAHSFAVSKSLSPFSQLRREKRCDVESDT